MIRCACLKVPEASVETLKMMLRLTSLMVTEAFAIAPPELSSTVPPMLPYTAWPRAQGATSPVPRMKKPIKTAKTPPEKPDREQPLNIAIPPLIASPYRPRESQDLHPNALLLVTTVLPCTGAAGSDSSA